ncbi:hypothetical protein Tco_0913189 [Tanacetum coccineum]
MIVLRLVFSRRDDSSDEGVGEVPLIPSARFSAGGLVYSLWAQELQNTNTSQAVEIATLKERVKKLEKKKRSRTHKPKRLYKVGFSRRIESSDEGLGDLEDASKQGRKIADIDADAEVTLVDETQGMNDDNLIFDTCVLDEQEVEVEKVVSTTKVTTASATTTTEEQAPASTLEVYPSQPSQVKDKGKAKMIEEEHVKKFSKKEQIRLDEEFAFKIQAEEQEQERIAREKAQKIQEANIAWDDIQATVEADYHSKRAGTELEQEAAKKEKIDDDQEEAEMKKLMEIVLDEEEIAVDAIPLATKPPIIVEWKIIKEGSSKRYSSMIQML